MSKKDTRILSSASRLTLPSSSPLLLITLQLLTYRLITFRLFFTASSLPPLYTASFPTAYTACVTV
jgi:hypothetical protein